MRYIFAFILFCSTSQADKITVARLPYYNDQHINRVEYEINGELGRARLIVTVSSSKYNPRPIEIPEYPVDVPVNVPGLSYDNSRASVVFLTASKESVICAQVVVMKDWLGKTVYKIKPTGQCSLSLVQTDEWKDDGFKRYKMTHHDLVFAAKE